MAHVLIIDEAGNARLAHLRQIGDACQLEMEDQASDDYKLSWKVLGVATMAVVSAAGWLGILAAARYFLH
jgi:hypothetical protein